MSLNLIVETPAPKEEFEYIVEEGNSKGLQNFFIKGPYMMAEGVNRNKRIYPLQEMVAEVARYKEAMVETGRAMGEFKRATDDLKNSINIDDTETDNFKNITKTIESNDIIDINTISEDIKNKPIEPDGKSDNE